MIKPYELTILQINCRICNNDFFLNKKFVVLRVQKRIRRRNIKVTFLFYIYSLFNRNMLLQVLRKFIATLQKPLYDATIGHPPFEKPCISKAVNNFIVYKLHSAQQEVSWYFLLFNSGKKTIISSLLQQMIIF